MRKKVLGLFILGLLAFGIVLFYEPSRTQVEFLYRKLSGAQTLEQRIEQYSEDVAERLRPKFENASIPYPPAEVAYLAFKDSGSLEVYARSSGNEPWRYVLSYPVLKASGRSGPKLLEGDRQVPEGVYKAEYLNPNSRYHLSIRVSYPNEFDRRMAKIDGRHRLGGDIMIHGSSVSIGCLAMGNSAIEDLFILSALTKDSPTRIVISPTDFRLNPGYIPAGGPIWTGKLYDDLRIELQHFRRKI